MKIRLWRVTGKAGKTGTDEILEEDLSVAVFLFGSLSRVGVKYFLRHRKYIPVSLSYVKDKKIRFLKFSKFR